MRFLRRLLDVALTLFGVAVVTFLMVRLIPGDPVDIMLGTNAAVSAERAEELRDLYGLNEPIVGQFTAWMGRIVSGDLGVSLRTGEPIREALLRRLPVTLELTALAMGVALLVGIPVGVAAALRQDTWVDHVLRVFSLVAMSIPNFVIAVIALLVGSIVFKWTPPLGYVSLLEDPVANLQQVFLPVLTLSAISLAFVVRMMRSSMLEVLKQDHVRTARAKGVRTWRVVVMHEIRNALIPVVAIVGIQIAVLLGGTVIIEQVFSLPGLGRLALNAISQRDYPVVQAVILLVAVMVVLTNLFVELLYSVLEPRMRQ
jgi:peptide/nickel transport system permease protein